MFGAPARTLQPHGTTPRRTRELVCKQRASARSRKSAAPAQIGPRHRRRASSHRVRAGRASPPGTRGRPRLSALMRRECALRTLQRQSNGHNEADRGAAARAVARPRGPHKRSAPLLANGTRASSVLSTPKRHQSFKLFANARARCVVRACARPAPRMNFVQVSGGRCTTRAAQCSARACTTTRAKLCLPAARRRTDSAWSCWRAG